MSGAPFQVPTAAAPWWWSHQINPPAVFTFAHACCRAAYIAVFAVEPRVKRAIHSYSRFIRSIW